MTRTPAKSPGREVPSKAAAEFEEILALIEAGRAVNVRLIDLYWKIGEVISRRIESDGWGKGTVQELSSYLSRTQRGARGFSPQNLWRMRQFFEVYRDAPDLSTLMRELPWSANLHILSGAKRPEEREFYLRMAIEKRWNVRELARQIQASAFERSVLGPPKLSTALREVHPTAVDDFKDVYSLEFIDLADGHSEADLHAALLRNLGRFITELGRDFCFVGSEYPIQVGNQDFVIDLVFFHRGLACLVAFELKVREFRPEDLGKLSFYLEALDRDVKKPHERPSIGVLAMGIAVFQRGSPKEAKPGVQRDPRQISIDERGRREPAGACRLSWKAETGESGEVEWSTAVNPASGRTQKRHGEILEAMERTRRPGERWPLFAWYGTDRLGRGRVRRR